jgi:CheY-like chemotaxis protein
MPTLESKTVLIVDDEEEVRGLFAAGFTREGCNVLQASNGKDAFALVQARPVDLVLTDFRMPGGDGLELLEWIKQHNPRYPRVMMVTGQPDVPAREARRLGADDVFGKPVSPSVLISAAREVLSKDPEEWLRGQPRFSVRIDAMFSYGAAPDLIPGYALNISRGGAFFSFVAGREDKLPLPSEHIAFWLSMPKEDSALGGRGVVRWARRMAQGSQPAGIGVQFLGLEGGGEQALKRLLSRLEKA